MTRRMRTIRWQIGLPCWLEDFKDNLVNEDWPAPAHNSRESDTESLVEVVTNSRKHSIYTHFPKDRNCLVCFRTKITKTICRRRIGEALSRSEKFGDLMTADHKVVNKRYESRDNHRFAVVVQDLATQSIQSYPSKTKPSQETQKSLLKFLEPSHRRKVVYKTTRRNLGEHVKFYHGVIALQHLIDPRQMALLKERPTSKGRYVSSIIVTPAVRNIWCGVVKMSLYAR